MAACIENPLGVAEVKKRLFRPLVISDGVHR